MWRYYFTIAIILILCILAYLFLNLSTAQAEPGFYSVTETVVNREETYQIVTGVTQVPVLNPQGHPTGKFIERPVTKKETRRWKEKTVTLGGIGVTFINVESPADFLGKDVRELIRNNHLEVAKDYMAVTYIESGVTPHWVPWREWVRRGRPAYLRFAPKYHYSGTPSITLSDEQFNKLLDP